MDKEFALIVIAFFYSCTIFVTWAVCHAKNPSLILKLYPIVMWALTTALVVITINY